MKKNRLFMMMLVTGVSVLLTACSMFDNATDKGVAEKTKVVTDLAGRQVHVPLEAKRIITTAPGHGGAFMTMCAILNKDVENYMVGWDNRLAADNKDMYNHYIKSIPKLKDLPDVGSVFRESFNVEKVIELAPDLCIFSIEEKAAIDASAAAQLDKAKIPYIYIQLVDEKTENQEKSARLIGEVLNKQKKTEEIIKNSIEKRKEVERRVAKINEQKKEKPKVYFECVSRGVDEYGWTYTNEVQWGLMTYMAGGDNISEGKYEKYGKMDLETLLRANPDHIFLAGSYWPKVPSALKMGYESTQADVLQQIEAYKERKGWNELKAVQNGNVHAIYLSMGCELFDFASLEFIAKTIYPEEFADMEPEKDLQEYFASYLPFELEGVWMVK